MSRRERVEARRNRLSESAADKNMIKIKYKAKEDKQKKKKKR